MHLEKSTSGLHGSRYSHDGVSCAWLLERLGARVAPPGLAPNAFPAVGVSNARNPASTF